MRSPNRLRVSIVDLSFIVWAVAVPLVLGPRLLNGDGDIPRHITMGEFILRGGLFQVDASAYTKTGLFATTEWLSQLSFGLAHRVGGLAAVAVLAGLVLGLSYALLVWFLRRSNVDPLFAYAVGVVAAVLASVHWVARPHLFTFLSVTVMLHLAVHGSRRLWVFLPFFALWANFHPGFVLGLGVLAACCAGELVEARFAAGDARRARLERARHHASALVLGAAGSILNPQGVGLLLRVRNVLSNEFLLSNTSEFTSLDFHTLYGRLVLVALVVIVAALALKPERPSFPRLFVVLLALAGALYARRNIPLFAMVALPILAVEFDALWRKLDWRPLTRLRSVFAAGERIARVGRWSPAVAGAMMILALNGGSLAGVRVVPAAFDAVRFPVGAVAAARAAGLEGRMFNEFTWGGYILYAWPEQKIFIDGMTDFLGNDVMQSYLTVHFLEPGWDDELRKHGVSLVIVPPRARLAYALRRTGEWDLWYEDSTAVVLERRAARTLAGRTASGEVTDARSTPRTESANGDQS